MKTRYLILQSLFFALIVAVTINVQIPMYKIGGYFNLGDFVIMTFVVLTGQISFGFTAGLASMFADILTPWPMYAPFTLVIKALLYFIVYITYKMIKRPLLKNTIPFLLGAIWIGVAYGITEGILYSSMTVVLPALIQNFIQGLVGAITTIMLLPVIDHLRRQLPKMR